MLYRQLGLNENVLNDELFPTENYSIVIIAVNGGGRGSMTILHIHLHEFNDTNMHYVINHSILVICRIFFLFTDTTESSFPI